MDPFQRYHYQVVFQLKVRSTFGTAFQDLFSTILEMAHGGDFIRIRPIGTVGDKGCDGYLTSSGTVYQGYGKVGDAGVSATLSDKVSDDYALASKHLDGVMKQWHFAHNISDGLPVTVVQKIKELADANPNHEIGLLGPPKLQEIVLGLSGANLLQLLGPAATAEDMRNLDLQEVRQAIDALMASIDGAPLPPTQITPVPADKLAFNKLPPHWTHLIEVGSKNSPYVQQYFERHPKADTGALVAAAFSKRYGELKIQQLGPGEIMDALYEKMTGIGSVTAKRQVAAYALLAYLFDACEIFEDHPSKVSA